MSARARVALNLMIDEGSVSTVRLKNMGYNHPPRVLADLKDAGIPFVMKRVRVAGESRSVAAYWLVDHINAAGETPRKTIPKWFKDKLLAEWNGRCAVCRGEYTARVLQPDHRIPFRIGGDPVEWDTKFFMPLCGSDNRAKSWSCETCQNWIQRDPNVCKSCYWASPDKYSHIAMIPERRVSLVIKSEDGIRTVDTLANKARAAGVSLQDYVADRLHDIS